MSLKQFQFRFQFNDFQTLFNSKQKQKKLNPFYFDALKYRVWITSLSF